MLAVALPLMLHSLPLPVLRYLAYASLPLPVLPYLCLCFAAFACAIAAFALHWLPLLVFTDDMPARGFLKIACVTRYAIRYTLNAISLLLSILLF